MDTLLRHSADMIGLIDSDGRILYVSPASREVIGEEPDDVVGKPLLDRVHRDDLGDARRCLDDILESSGRSFDLELRLRHKDGSWRRVEIRAQNRLQDPEIEAVVCDVRDVTGRREAEARERRLLEMVETAADFVGLCDVELRVIFVNRAGLQMLGRDEDAPVEGESIGIFHDEETG